MVDRLLARVVSASLPMLCWLGLSGCVLPVGPDFQDPSPNLPPSVVTAEPRAGEVLVGGQEISISVSDPNLTDTLYVRWVFDYPPVALGNTRFFDGGFIPPPADENTIRQVRPFTPSCLSHNLSPNLTTHRVWVAIADREFTHPDDAPGRYPYEDVADGGNVTVLSWSLELDCSP